MDLLIIIVKVGFNFKCYWIWIIKKICYMMMKSIFRGFLLVLCLVLNRFLVFCLVNSVEIYFLDFFIWMIVELEVSMI